MSVKVMIQYGTSQIGQSGTQQKTVYPWRLRYMSLDSMSEGEDVKIAIFMHFP